jgi:hypothetical protein
MSSTNSDRKMRITTITQPRASQSFRGGSAPRYPGAGSDDRDWLTSAEA